MAEGRICVPGFDHGSTFGVYLFGQWYAGVGLSLAWLSY